ncbi:MAG: AbgT family transporter [Clostridia bacterium]|nr:AbgT family transporter [Clostridia bacterium]
MDESVKTEALPSEKKENNSGLQLNKKSIALILVLLTVILAFAGVLTQVMPRGEYYTYPENTYKLSDGTFVTLQTDSEFTVDKTEKMSESEYLSRLASLGHEVKAVESFDGLDIDSAEDVGNMIIDGTYHKIDYRLPIWKIPASLILVFGSDNVTTGIAIIVFIVLIGGTFLILDERGILKYIMAVIIKKFEKKKYLLLCIMIFVCMFLSSTAGILEESVTLVPIAVAISLALGWDSLVGLSISLVAIAFGFTAATFNPFNVVTVQKLAGIPVFSGLWLRIVMFVLVYAVLATFVVLYAKKIEKDPKKSISYESDKALREKYRLEDSEAVLADEKTKKATRAFVLCVCAVIVCIILDFALSLSGMLSMPGMAILFTVGGLSAGYLSGLRGKKLANGFVRGVKTIAPAIPLIFFILAITYILDEGMIVHTILNYVYSLIRGLSPYSAILLLFAFVVVLEFFIGSGTAKAFLIMPIVAPLAQLVGISGNSVVLTFCMGDGFTNLLYPTSGIMIIAIGLVNVSYGKWLKFTWKLFLAEAILAVAIMHFSIFIGYA